MFNQMAEGPFRLSKADVNFSELAKTLEIPGAYAMNVAVLFNSDHPTLGGWYGGTVMRRILGTNVLQRADRNMRVSIGDILTFFDGPASKEEAQSDYLERCRRLYQPAGLDLLIREKLQATFGRATVYCWLVQNATVHLSKELHRKLEPDPAYLGIMGVNLADPYHLRFFRNSLVESYRFFNTHCTIFYSMAGDDDPDMAVSEILEDSGYKVEYEDSGARQTIFDNYDSLEHFERVEDFRRVFSSLEGVTEDKASDLALTLEELHPKLFNAFASAARALERAETEEDLAQAATSGRRLLEQTADYLFPPREEKWNGRTVGKTQYQNRLWAYLEQTLTSAGQVQSGVLQDLGGELDKFIKLFNTGLHSELSREKLENGFRDLVLWLSRVIELNPAEARKPYLAYEEQMKKFMRALSDEKEHKKNDPAE